MPGGFYSKVATFGIEPGQLPADPHALRDVSSIFSQGFATEGQFRLFDPQICGELKDDWLAYAVESHGITRSELDAMIAVDGHNFGKTIVRVAA